MTVEHIGEESHISIDRIGVTWFEDEKLRRDSFQRDVLEKVKSYNRKQTWVDILDSLNAGVKYRKERVSNSGHYRIKINDFGPIAHAEVDLRPLTVFIGPSNTGKSYLAILIYALHHVFRAGSEPRWLLSKNPKNSPFPAFSSIAHSDSLKKVVGNFLQNLTLSDAVRLEEGQLEISLPKDSAAAIRHILGQPGIERRLESEICRCFGIRRIDQLVRRENDNPNRGAIGVTVPESQNVKEIDYVLEFGKFKSRFSAEFPNIEKISFSTEIVEDIRFSEAVFGRDMDDMILPYILYSIFGSITSPLSCQAFYLPSDRTGIMHSHQVVVSTLIRNAATAGIRHSNSTPMLSGVLADFMDNLIRMSNHQRPQSSAKLDEPLQNKILQGTVDLLRQPINYPTLTYKPAGWKRSLPIMRTSSMVAEIAPLILYLRYLVRPGHLLIIEEPESHLHPAMQTVLARELVRLMRAGIRVILTTHSDWFLEQLGNLVRLGILTESERNKLGGSDYVIHSDEIGVWLFEHKQNLKGTYVRELSFDSETGLYPTDYHAVRDRLYNESADIFNQNPDLFNPLDEETDE